MLPHTDLRETGPHSKAEHNDRNGNRTEPFALDLDEAGRFLAPLDPTAECPCFQTFNDRSTAKSLPRTIHGTLSDIASTLIRLNPQGAGIFTTPNAIAPGQRRLA